MNDINLPPTTPANTTETPNQSGRSAGTVSVILGSLSILLVLVPFATAVLATIGLIVSIVQTRKMGTTVEGYAVRIFLPWKAIPAKVKIGLVLSLIGVLLSPIGLMIGILGITFAL